MQSNKAGFFNVSEVELIYRNKVKPADRHKIRHSRHAYDILLSAWDMNKIEMIEHFYVMLLDRSQSCLGISHIFTGGIAGCLVDPKVIFATALKANASSIILAHNHPSGNLTPSRADVELTEKLKSGGALLDISVSDHLIVTPFNYFSFADEYLPF